MTALAAPIALFVYNRPEHTRRTLEALRANEGAEHSKLYIFADGAKENAQTEGLERIDSVRKLIRQDRWCGRVEIIEANENRGLAGNICMGVSEILKSDDRVIVLEDDLETSPGFLRYMNDALEIYKEAPCVYQIAGFMVPNRPWLAPTGFLRVTTSWGWATWRRAWAHYRHDAANLLAEVDRKGRSAFDLDGHSFHFEELERNVRGELSTWAVRWYASIFLQDGLCVYPRHTLVRNIGFDGSGAHCHDDPARYHQSRTLARRIAVNPQTPAESAAYLRAMQNHYDLLLKTWTRTRLRDRVRRKLGRWLEAVK